MKSISITPGKNNVGAYINDVNLNNLNNVRCLEILLSHHRFGDNFICLFYKWDVHIVSLISYNDLLIVL